MEYETMLEKINSLRTTTSHGQIRYVWTGQDDGLMMRRQRLLMISIVCKSGAWLTSRSNEYSIAIGVSIQSFNGFLAVAWAHEVHIRYSSVLRWIIPIDRHCDTPQSTNIGT